MICKKKKKWLGTYYNHNKRYNLDNISYNYTRFVHQIDRCSNNLACNPTAIRPRPVHLRSRDYRDLDTVYERVYKGT